MFIILITYTTNIPLFTCLMWLKSFLKYLFSPIIKVSKNTIQLYDTTTKLRELAHCLRIMCVKDRAPILQQMLCTTVI